VGKSREVCLQAGELLWTQIELCRAQRFQVFAFTNAVSIFVLRHYEFSLELFWQAIET